MEMKIIILCEILGIMTFLLGLFRLRWLRKCYDKARAEKKDVLEREQKALAFKQLETYYKAKAATWKSMGIAVAVFVILGGAVWGIGRIVQVYKAEKEQAKVEKQVDVQAKVESSLFQDFFHYFSYDANLERFVKNRQEGLNKARAEYFEANQNLTKARQSGDLAQITKYSLKVDDAEHNLDSAQFRYDNLNNFEGHLGDHRLGFWLLAIFLFVFGLYFAFVNDEEGLMVSSFFSVFFVAIAIFSLIFSFFATWLSWLTLLLIICNILIFIKRRKKIFKAWK